jgi:hypothetical protein
MKLIDIITIVGVVVIFICILLIYFYYKKFVSNYKPFGNVWKKKNKDGVPYSQVIQKLLTTVISKFQEQNIQIIPMYGTLLGLVRQEGIIEWDDDVDVIIEKSEWDWIRNNRTILEKDGISISPPSLNGTLMKCYYNSEPIIDGVTWSWPFIDLFYYRVEGDNIISPYSVLKSTFKKSSIFPLHKKIISGIEYNMPNNPEEILDISYKGWKDTCVSTDYNHRLERPIFPWNIYKMPTSQLKYKTNNIFNNVYIINLKRRPDRLESSKKELAKLDIQNPFILEATDCQDEEFKKMHNSISQPKMSLCEMACYKSHQRLWQKLVDSNEDFAIIFEDDISIPSTLTKKDILNYIDASRGFNILFLGHCYSSKFLKPKVKPGTALCMHAYVISRNGAKLLLKEGLHKNIPIDHLVKNICKDNLCFITHSSTSNSLINIDGGLISQMVDVSSDIPNKNIAVF